MIDFSPFLNTLQRAGLEKWAAQLAVVLPKLMTPERHGDMDRWLNALAALPDVGVADVDLNRNSIRVAGAARRSIRRSASNCTAR